VRIGERSVGWIEEELERWMQERAAQPRVQITTSGIANRERQRARVAARKAVAPEAA
jgi:hypothetical protein